MFIKKLKYNKILPWSKAGGNLNTGSCSKGGRNELMVELILCKHSIVVMMTKN